MDTIDLESKLGEQTKEQMIIALGWEFSHPETKEYGIGFWYKGELNAGSVDEAWRKELAN